MTEIINFVELNSDWWKDITRKEWEKIKKEKNFLLDNLKWLKKENLLEFYSRLDKVFEKKWKEIYKITKNDLDDLKEVYEFEKEKDANNFIKNLKDDPRFKKYLEEIEKFDPYAIDLNEIKEARKYFWKEFDKDSLFRILDKNRFFPFFDLIEVAKIFKEKWDKISIKNILDLLEINNEFDVYWLGELKAYFWDEIDLNSGNLKKYIEVPWDMLVQVWKNFNLNFEQSLKLFNKLLSKSEYFDIDYVVKLKNVFSDFSINKLLSILELKPKIDLSLLVKYKDKLDFLTFDKIKYILEKNKNFNFKSLKIFIDFKKLKIYNLLKDENGFYEQYLNLLVTKNYTIWREGRNILLGKEYLILRKYFKANDDFKYFIDLLVRWNNNKFSKRLSQTINDIYDYNDEHHIWWTKLDKNILEWLKRFSNEELISVLGNHVENYSHTFKLILKELKNRWLSWKKLLDYVEKNKNLTEETKIFLKWQYIIWLLARNVNYWRDIISLLNSLSIKEKNYLWDNVFLKILNYKKDKNTIFTEWSYSGLLIGLENLYEKDSFIKNKIDNYFNTTENNTFKLWWVTIKLLKHPELYEKYKNNSLYKEAYKLIKSLKINKEILQKKVNDIVSIYWWKWEGAGLPYLKYDIKFYLNKWYKKIYFSEGIYIFEKKWIRYTLINFDKYDKNWDIDVILKNELKKHWISADLFVFRGHNYYTSKMIEKLWKNFLWNTTILDWWCRNFSRINYYREHWIDNSLIAYTNTWKWLETQKIIKYFSKFLIENKGKNIDITWNDFAKKYVKSKYIKNYVKFPWNMLDLILKIEENKK